MVCKTTIKIDAETKKDLLALKLCKDEPYYEVIKRLIRKKVK